MAQKDKIQIIVEIKSFQQPSVIHSFYGAFGQYLAYRDALVEGEIDSKIYLAVSEETYERFDEVKFIKRRFAQYQIKLIVVDIEQEIIARWIE